MNSFCVLSLFNLLLIRVSVSSTQQKSEVVSSDVNVSDKKIEFPNEKSIRVPIISNIQNILRPTKPNDENIENQNQTPIRKPMNRPKKPSDTPDTDIEDEAFDDKPSNSDDFKPQNNFGLTDESATEEEEENDIWGKENRVPKSPNQMPPWLEQGNNGKPGNSKPNNIAPWAQSSQSLDNRPNTRPNVSSKPQSIASPWNDSEYEEGYAGVYNPNTIQQWMNDMRPTNQKPGIAPDIMGDKPINRPNENKTGIHLSPWMAPNANGEERPPPGREQKPVSAIKPSYDPPPWHKPKPDSRPTNTKPFVDEDIWWDSKPDKDTTLRPKSTTKSQNDESYSQWESNESDRPKYKPKPEEHNGSGWADEHGKPEWSAYPKPSRPKPESGYRPSATVKPFKPWNEPEAEYRPPRPPKPSNPWSEPEYRPTPSRPNPEPVPEYRPPTQRPSRPEPLPQWTGNPNLPPWWNSKPSAPEPYPEPEGDMNGFGGNIFSDNSGNGIGGMGDTNGIGGARVGNNSGNGEGGVGDWNGLGGNVLKDNGANGVGGVGNSSGVGGFIIGNDSGNGKGGVGNNNGIGGNKGGKNSANGTGGVGNNNGIGGIIIGSNSGNGVGGVNTQNGSPSKPNQKS